MKLRSLTVGIVGLGIIFPLLPRAGAASDYQVLHAFSSGSDGGGVYSGVALDAKGNLYGTTSGGGAYGAGTVFRLKRQPNGQWTEKILHSFDFHQEGAEPSGTPVVDSADNVYGTGYFGGAHNGGSVFELIPGQPWSEQILYSFGDNGDGDGGGPYAGLVQDAAGNFYGTTVSGFPPNAQSGTIYQLSHAREGWIESVLYRFCAQPDCTDGTGAYAGVVVGKGDILYGTTEGGGNYSPTCPVGNGCGVVFRVKPLMGGGWKYAVLHRFAAFSSDGQGPGVGQLALDGSGNLYGTTSQGGKNSCGAADCGTIFRLTRQPDGHWKETILHHFKRSKGGNTPAAGVVLDSAGNLYGTTTGGGSDCDCGVIYKLSPNPDNTWTYTVLHRFTGYDGAEPGANMILDDKGNLYGTTVTGGPGGYGVVFKITP